MIVRCLYDYPSEERIAQLGTSFYRSQSFGLTIGKEYVVVGLYSYVNSSLRGTGLYVEYVDDDGTLLQAPILLFEIVDARLSQFWQMRVWEDGTFTARPPSLECEYYHARLSDGLVAYVQDFEKVYAMLMYEAAGEWDCPAEDTEEWGTQ